MAPLRIFLITFLLGLLAQGWLWHTITIIDYSLWAQHSKDMYLRDSRMFDPGVYGHPGTPIALLTIVASRVGGLTYGTALLGSITVLVAATVASVTTLAYRLRPSLYWWLTLPPLLLLNPLYLAATPPTAVASPLIVLLVLISWWIYEKGPGLRLRWLFLWSVVAGLAAATRTDITGVTALPLLLFLMHRLGWRHTALTAVVSFLIFALTNPFMWFMPVQHVLDLVGVALFHYTEYNYASSTLSALSFITISPLSLVSVALAALVVCLRALPTPIPRPFIIFLIVLCSAVTTLLLNSHWQVPRYFFPYAFVWEALLPLFLLTLIEQLHMPWLSRLTLVFFIVLTPLLLLHFLTLPTINVYCLPFRSVHGTWCDISS